MATAKDNGAPFKFVLVKTRLNPRKIDALKALGVRLVERTDTRALELRAEHAAQRGQRHYVRLGERENAAGRTVGDSGINRIKFNPDESQQGGAPADPTKAMSLGVIAADLGEIGYKLVDLHILQRPGERNGMGFLVLVYQLAEESLTLSGPLNTLVMGFCYAYYRSVFVYENPDDSATVNANAAVNGSDLDKVTDRRNLRLDFSQQATHWESQKQKP